MARIFLIGPMGSGKTTVGKSLARKLNYPFIDTDKEIEARCGVDIPTIFEFEGEAGFRDREHKIINELTRTDPVILATGGGSILDETNRKRLHARGHVILLSVDIKEQLRRVSLNKNRPLLQVDDVEQRLVKLMDQRRELYESTAHHIVNTNSSRMQNVLAKIMRHLQRNNIAEIPPPKRESRRPASKKVASSSNKPATGKSNGPGKRKTQESKRERPSGKAPATRQTSKKSAAGKSESAKRTTRDTERKSTNSKSQANNNSAAKPPKNRSEAERSNASNSDEARKPSRAKDFQKSDQ